MTLINEIKRLRAETGVSILECKKALEETKGSFNRAKDVLRKWGRDLAEKKTKREVGFGIVDNYIHPDKRIGVIIELWCETDFVAKSDYFKNLAHEICLQIAAMNPNAHSLMFQPWIKDETKTIKDLIDEHIAKLGENITVKRFTRYEI